MAVARSGYGRRRFVQLLGWAGVVAMARGGPALAAAAAKSRAKSTPPAPPPPAAPVAPTPPAAPAAEAPSEEARALAEVVRRRYGDQLSESDLQTITRDIDGDLRGAKRLRDLKLANADEPDTTFHA